MRLSFCLLASLLATNLAAQTVARHIAEGDSAGLMHPEVQLKHYQAALGLDSVSYEANWKAARAIADVAKQIQGNADSLKHRRDSLYSVGRTYAERAIRADSTKPDGHYALAMVLGRLSRTKGSKEPARCAKIIFDEATRAVQSESSYDMAHPVFGAWNAEVKRLSGFQRFFAKALFGGGIMDKANWPDAVRHLERAVAIAPNHIYNRLVLDEVLSDLGLYCISRMQCKVIV